MRLFALSHDAALETFIFPTRSSDFLPWECWWYSSSWAFAPPYYIRVLVQLFRRLFHQHSLAVQTGARFRVRWTGAEGKKNLCAAESESSATYLGSWAAILLDTAIAERCNFSHSKSHDVAHPSVQFVVYAFLPHWAKNIRKTRNACLDFNLFSTCGIRTVSWSCSNWLSIIFL